MIKEPVRVHRNLHRARKGGAQWVLTKRGRVARYAESLTIELVTTRIQVGGRLRCEREQVRNVCGYLDGVECEPAKPTREWRRIGFDPRKDEAFTADGKRWNRADCVILTVDGSAWVLNPTWQHPDDSTNDEEKNRGRKNTD